MNWTDEQVRNATLYGVCGYCREPRESREVTDEKGQRLIVTCPNGHSNLGALMVTAEGPMFEEDLNSAALMLLRTHFAEPTASWLLWNRTPFPVDGGADTWEWAKIIVRDGLPPDDELPEGIGCLPTGGETR